MDDTEGYKGSFHKDDDKISISRPASMYLPEIYHLGHWYKQKRYSGNSTVRAMNGHYEPGFHAYVEHKGPAYFHSDKYAYYMVELQDIYVKGKTYQGKPCYVGRKMRIIEKVN